MFEGYDVLDGWSVVGDGGDEVLVSRAWEEEGGLGCLEHVGDFLGTGAVVEGDEYGVELGAGKVGLDEFGGIDVHEGDALSRLQAELGEGVGEAIDLTLQSLKGDASAFEDDGRPVRDDGGGDGEEFEDVHGVGRGYYSGLKWSCQRTSADRVGIIDRGNREREDRDTPPSGVP